MSFTEDIRKALWTVAPFSTDYSPEELKAASSMVASLNDLRGKLGAASYTAAAHEAAAETEADARQRTAATTGQYNLQQEQTRGATLRDIHWPTTAEGAQYMGQLQKEIHWPQTKEGATTLAQMNANLNKELAQMGYGRGGKGVAGTILDPHTYFKELLISSHGKTDQETGQAYLPSYARQYMLENLPRIKSMDDALKIWREEAPAKLEPFRQIENLSSPAARQKMLDNYNLAAKLGMAPKVQNPEDYFLRGKITPETARSYELWMNWKSPNPQVLPQQQKSSGNTLGAREDQNLFSMIPG